jgi:hypothetical protein
MQEMTLMKRFLLALRLPLAAQSVDKILKQATKALGDEKALRRLRSWQAQGSVTRRRDGESGKYEAAALAPNLYWGCLICAGWKRAWATTANPAGSAMRATVCAR